MARGPTSQKVEFATTVKTLRPPHDDERIVMEHFADHAKRCQQCVDPYQTHLDGRQLCERGHAYARDVVTYIYSKGGKPFSVLDKKRYDERNQIEVPAGCEPVRGLIKAIDRGLTLRRREQKHKPVISQDPVYLVPERREPRPERYSAYNLDANIVTITPSSAKKDRRERDKYVREKDLDRVERRSTHGKGSLYHIDEAEKKQRRQYEQEPVIIYAEPKNRSSSYKR